MKKGLKIILSVLSGVLFSSLIIQSSPVHVHALDDYTNEEGQTQYGWSLVANETNVSCWEFDEQGELAYCYAAEGDTANQRVYNYALRNLAIQQDDSYSVSCVFTPDPDSDLSAERAYGLVCWYQDADNYLLYWMQQKTGGDWSGQFYGRINGSFRKMWMPESCASGAIPYVDGWRKGEYYDLWWDQSKNSHPAICNERNALLTTTIQLKVVSSLEECTVAGETKTCRKFELHQIIHDEDFISCIFYVEQLNANSGDFYTGVYSECFSVGLSDFTITTTNTDFATPVKEKINALPETIVNESQIIDVMQARNAYEGLLSYQSLLTTNDVEKLTTAEEAVGLYVDNKIMALDHNKSSFKQDVDAAYNLFISLNEILQGKVTKVTELSNAINEAKDWKDPNTSTSESASEVLEPSDSVSSSTTDHPSESSSGNVVEPQKGCKGNAMASSFLLIMMALFALSFCAFQKKYNKQ